MRKPEVKTQVETFNPLGDEIPGLSVDLIRWLDKQHPPRCIGPFETPEQAHRYAGRRDMIDELLVWVEEQEHAAAAEAEAERGSKVSTTV